MGKEWFETTNTESAGIKVKQELQRHTMSPVMSPTFSDPYL